MLITVAQTFDSTNLHLEYQYLEKSHLKTVFRITVSGDDSQQLTTYYQLSVQLPIKTL